jgi:hypothetical protein
MACDAWDSSVICAPERKNPVACALSSDPVEYGKAHGFEYGDGVCRLLTAGSSVSVYDAAFSTANGRSSGEGDHCGCSTNFRLSGKPVDRQRDRTRWRKFTISDIGVATQL